MDERTVDVIVIGGGPAGSTCARVLQAAGKRVAVVTIDPARRLADSLGLSELGNTERQVDPALFERAGTELDISPAERLDEAIAVSHRAVKACDAARGRRTSVAGLSRRYFRLTARYSDCAETRCPDRNGA